MSQRLGGLESQRDDHLPSPLAAAGSHIAMLRAFTMFFPSPANSNLPPTNTFGLWDHHPPTLLYVMYLCSGEQEKAMQPPPPNSRIEYTMAISYAVPLRERI
mmetsp:Transcript_38829/g.122360  ORF Transcript_38829/g.122360 Transcript_38829/m.122360 type:complete len:102 (+) Transcript_38829:800-1105(+)